MKTKSTFFFFVFAACASTYMPAHTQVNVQDSLALVTLYDSTDGPNWFGHDNWLTGPVSTWYGITVAGDRVTAINFGDPFFGNNLKGNIPPEIGNLTNLQSLDLFNNQITGIPPGIGNLTNLQNLDLGKNQITNLPPEIGNLASLLILDLRLNQIADLPPEIGNLTNLQRLAFDFNQITNISPGIGDLSSLQYLNLSFNQLTNLPPEIGKLASLQELQLQNNQITILPPKLGSLINLEVLALSENQITILPVDIGGLTNLLFLSLEGNQITSLPVGIGNLTSLRNLDLGVNQLTGLPTEIGNLTSLQNLSLSKNKLTSLPAELGNLTNLQNLYLSNNKLTSVPPELASLYPDCYLDLSYNNFTFEDLEWIVKPLYTNLLYYPQANIPVHQSGNALSVSSGGTLSNNTYRWFMVGAGDTTIVGDSVFHPSQSGQYYAAVTNSICIQLALNTDTIFYDAALPVSIINLKAYPQGKQNKIEWTSVTEINIDTYEIQRSSNTTNFVGIGRAKSTGNGTQKAEYNFTDVKPLIGNNYYRLKIFDEDGKITYSNIVLVNMNHSNRNVLVYPVPANSILTVETNGNTEFCVLDQSGKILFTATINDKGTIDVSHLNAGTYFLRDNNTGNVQKVIIIR